MVDAAAAAAALLARRMEVCRSGCGDGAGVGGLMARWRGEMLMMALYRKSRDARLDRGWRAGSMASSVALRPRLAKRSKGDGFSSGFDDQGYAAEQSGALRGRVSESVSGAPLGDDPMTNESANRNRS